MTIDQSETITMNNHKWWALRAVPDNDVLGGEIVKRYSSDNPQYVINHERLQHELRVADIAERNLYSFVLLELLHRNRLQ